MKKDEKIIDKYIGARIKSVRVSLKMSQSDLAQALGITFQQVQKYESGVNRVAVSRLIHIAEAFRMPVYAFLPKTIADIQIDDTDYVRVERAALKDVISKLSSMTKKGQ
jgi:transcriptional regulator with XRE-family HTH domain